jgi:hypothetical protein
LLAALFNSEAILLGLIGWQLTWVDRDVVDLPAIGGILLGAAGWGIWILAAIQFSD